MHSARLRLLILAGVVFLVFGSQVHGGVRYINLQLPFDFGQWWGGRTYEGHDVWQSYDNKLDAIDWFYCLSHQDTCKFWTSSTTASEGMNLRAACSGTVVRLKYLEPGYGNSVVIRSDENSQYLVLYAHLQEFAPGMAVGKHYEAGDLIGKVGTTGSGSGGFAHLHMELEKYLPDGVNWAPVDVSNLEIDGQVVDFANWSCGTPSWLTGYMGKALQARNSLQPPTLRVTPETNFESAGSVGGPFSPASMTYTLTNSSGSTISWVAGKTQGWLDLSPTSGSLPGGGSVSVTASINSGAAGLPVGVYNDTISFTNLTNGSGDTTRGVILRVTPLPNAPTNLRAVGISVSRIDLTWDAPTQGVAASYRIYRDGSYLAGSSTTSYSDTSVLAGRVYTYTVSAVDAGGKESPRSAPATGAAWAVVFQDGFPNVSGWTPGVVADGTTRGVSFDGSQNHGIFAGSGSALTAVGSSGTNGCWSYKSFSAPFTCGRLEGWFRDTGTNDNNRQGIHLRGYDSGGGLQFSVYLGTYSNTSTSAYSGMVYSGGVWTYSNAIQARSVGWREFRIDIMPVTVDGIGFYIDGVLKAVQNRPSTADTYGISRVFIGHNYNTNVQGWFDDVRFSVPMPEAPTMGSPTVAMNAISWPFTNNCTYQSGFVLHDENDVVKMSIGKTGTKFDETGLSPNTRYTRHIHALNGSVDGIPSATISRYTLSVPPTSSLVTCDRNTSTPYTTPGFNFTAVGGFGAGRVEYYRYVWDRSPTHVWTGLEAKWSEGTLGMTATSAGNWYLHVKGYNGDGVENGSLDLGPYVYSGPSLMRIGEAKALPDGTEVALAGKVVTGKFANFFYIEEEDRSSGIRVEGSVPSVGALVSVTGVMATRDGERLIENTSVQASGSALVPGPVAMPNWSVGGSSLNAYTPGMTYGCGVHNVGLLGITWGRVTFVGAGYFYIDDGSNLSDGSGNTGIRVDSSALTKEVSVGQRAIVTGIISAMKVGSTVAPFIRARGDADVLLF